MTSSTPLRIGILGPARIAADFVAGARGLERVRIDAVASRDAARARVFAAAHGLARTHDSYAAMVSDPQLDLIYIALPNALHAPWALAALRAGKHVLCEKPLCSSGALAAELFDAAQAHGVTLLEAFPYRFQPYMDELLRLLGAGEIGDLREAHAGFGITLREGPNVRLSSELEGGALFDVGCYPVSVLRAMLGRVPRRVVAQADWDASGVDRSLSGLLDYGDGVHGSIACSFDHAPHRAVRIAGRQGVIETTYPNTPDPARAHVIGIRRGTAWRMDFDSIEQPPRNGFRCELEAICAMIDGTRGDHALLRSESIDNAATLAALLASARSGQWCEVASVAG
jgi:predicted dehydrogenase